MCGCGIFISAYMMQYELNSCRWRKIEKSDISLWNIALKKIRQLHKGKTDDCINEVYRNGSHQHEKASHSENPIYCRDMNEYPDSIPNWNF